MQTMAHNTITTEQHPLKPFLPQNAKVLMLGSFPPPQIRWSMNFYYPNFQNDMWRIMGLIFFGNRHHFEHIIEHRFDEQRVVEFCARQGIALHDTAQTVRRLRNNASDNHLEVVNPTNIDALLAQIPQCYTIATTGEKSTSTFAKLYTCSKPPVGGHTPIKIGKRTVNLYRMPSSSRAYPLALERKAESYKQMLRNVGIL